MEMWEATPELERALDEWEREWRSGSREQARELAPQVAGLLSPTTRQVLEAQTQEQLVWLIDAARGERPWADNVVKAAPERVRQIQVFIMAKFEPQQIVGESSLGSPTELLSAAVDALKRQRRSRGS